MVYIIASFAMFEVFTIPDITIPPPFVIFPIESLTDQTLLFSFVAGITSRQIPIAIDHVGA